MMDINQGKYFGMNQIGLRIWQLIQKEISFLNISEKLMEEYTITPKQCDNELRKFLDKLKDNNLVSIVNDDHQIS